MGKPMADYVKLPELEEYKEWFKDFADLYREDGILQVTWKTLDGPMHHSGMSHRAISQLVRVLSLDYKNEIIIFTHIGDHWMTESDPNGGAMALGHPLGATGAVLSCKAISELRRTGGKYAMVTMCIAGGMGAAGIFKAD